MTPETQRALHPFEQRVLDTLREMGETYSVPLADRLSEQMGEHVGIGTLYAALGRLEDGGLVTSRDGDATEERGWRNKRYFRAALRAAEKEMG